MFGFMAGLQGMPAMGAVLCLGAGWPSVEALGHPKHPTSISMLMDIKDCTHNLLPQI